MAFAIAGTIAASAVRVRHTDTVNTSFPGFADCLRFLGGTIEPVGPAPA
jgi:5-enolpyruvylshikimate-3-phosphate synthase